MKLSHLLFSIITAILLSASALAQNAPLKKADGILVDSAGMAVYTFDKDTAGNGKSACNGSCAALWPPVPAGDAVTAPYSVVTRDDGTKQLAYKGKPLYRYAADKKPGDRSGDKVKDVWHVVAE